jgi:hypothetical protein
MRKTLVPQVGQTPWVAVRPFFITIDFGFLITTIFLSFIQYACIFGMHPVLTGGLDKL